MTALTVDTLRCMSYEDAVATIEEGGANARLVLEAFADRPGIVEELEEYVIDYGDNEEYIRLFYATAARLKLPLNPETVEFSSNYSLILLTYPEWFSYGNDYMGGPDQSLAPEFLDELYGLTRDDFEKYAGAYVAALSKIVDTRRLHLFVYEYRHAIVNDESIHRLVVAELERLACDEKEDVGEIMSLL